MTSKLQLTVPKVMAEKYGIRPGDELEWIPAGDGIRVRLVRNNDLKAVGGAAERLALFDENTRWLDQLQSEDLKRSQGESKRTTRDNRGWTREELHGDRGLPGRH